MIRENPRISEGSQELAVEALRTLELELYRYSIGCVHAHATADPWQLSWMDELIFLIVLLKSQPAATLDDLSNGERATLRLLQRSVCIQWHLSKLDEAIICLQEFINAGPAADFDDVCLRKISLALTLDLGWLEKDMPYFNQFIFGTHFYQSEHPNIASNVNPWQHTSPVKPGLLPSHCSACTHG